jgi:hypothetical protein
VNVAGEKPKKSAAGKAGPGALEFVRGLFTDSRNQLNLKLVNALLLACVVVLAVRFGYVIDGAYKKMHAIDFRLTADVSGELREKSVLKKLDYYLDKVKKRDIFRMGAEARPENALEAAPSSKVAEATQNLRLVGISWSDDPDAMVEDTKTLKTFFVKKGQSIGDVKVENITREKVILRLDRELIELR